MLSLPGVWVRSLVWELGSHKSHGAAKNKQKNPNKEKEGWTYTVSHRIERDMNKLAENTYWVNAMFQSGCCQERRSQGREFRRRN